MRICVISDLHANLEALSALPQNYDELWVLGDLVNYGPDPAATIDFVRSHASPLWDQAEEASKRENTILAGHTHLQFSRRSGERVIVNPGSLGQSKAGDPLARYAVWENGYFELKAREYPLETTAKKITAMPIADNVKRDLIQVLRTGTMP